MFSRIFRGQKGAFLVLTAILVPVIFLLPAWRQTWAKAGPISPSSRTGPMLLCWQGPMCIK